MGARFDTPPQTQPCEVVEVCNYTQSSRRKFITAVTECSVKLDRGFSWCLKSCDSKHSVNSEL